MEVSGTPMEGGVLTNEIEGKMITMNEPSPGKVQIKRYRSTPALTISVLNWDTKSKITN